MATKHMTVILFHQGWRITVKETSLTHPYMIGHAKLVEFADGFIQRFKEGTGPHLTTAGHSTRTIEVATVQGAGSNKPVIPPSKA